MKTLTLADFRRAQAISKLVIFHQDQRRYSLDATANLEWLRRNPSQTSDRRIDEEQAAYNEAQQYMLKAEDELFTLLHKAEYRQDHPKPKAAPGGAIAEEGETNGSS